MTFEVSSRGIIKVWVSNRTINLNMCFIPGVDSGFKHVVPEGHDTKLYQIRRVKGKTTVLQVPARKES